MLEKIKQRWAGPDGCLEVLMLSLPLIISVGSFTIQMFVDRVFLARYHPDAMAGASMASALFWTIFSLSFGVATYSNTFVAQYYGAKRPERIGSAIWQSIHFSVVAGLLLMVLSPLAPHIFPLFKHDPAVMEHEITYFRYICFGAVFQLISVSLTSFYTGRRKNMILMIVRVIANLVNILADYVLIFGHFGFPRMGVVGAVWGTIIASGLSMVIFFILFMLPENRRQYASLAGWRPERDLLRRLIRYGTPNGVQYFLDGLAFTIFIILVGRIGKNELAASAMAFQINTLAFLPMVGMGIAITTMVGNAIGDNKPERGAYATWSAAIVAFTCMTLMGLGFILVPDWFMMPYRPPAMTPENMQLYVDLAQQHDQFPKIAEMVVVLLRFVAFYCLFDTGNVIFAAALKGAGDTRFIMWVSLTLHWVVMVIPAYIVYRLDLGLYALWGCLTGFVVLLAIAFLLRFLQGKWKTMRVIETPPEPIPPVSTLPTIEVDSN